MDWSIFATVVSVIAAAIGLPGLILFFLNRKDANRKLDLEAGSLTVDQFQAQTAAYQDLLDRANSALSEANAKLAEAVTQIDNFKEEREELQRKVSDLERAVSSLEKSDTEKTQQLTDTNTKLDRLRTLFTSVVDRAKIELTYEEQRIFEETHPVARRGRR